MAANLLEFMVEGGLLSGVSGFPDIQSMGKKSHKVTQYPIQRLRTALKNLCLRSEIGHRDRARNRGESTRARRRLQKNPEGSRKLDSPFFLPSWLSEATRNFIEDGV
jgi:hypothetical protein